MNAKEVFAEIRAFPIAPLPEIASGGGGRGLAPHQVDESLGCGGLIAQATACGLDVRLVFASDGADSHPKSQEYPPERLRKTREAEACAAADMLGTQAEHVTFLRLPDRYVPQDAAQAEAAIDSIAALAERSAAGAIFTSWHGVRGKI